MRPGWTQVRRCDLCGSSALEGLFSASDPHYRIPGRFSLSRCSDCSLVFLDPRPDLPTLASLYPKDSYYAYQDCFAKPPAFKRFLAKILLNTDTQDPSFPAPGRLLDVGCGSGAFMASMRSNGWAVTGVEISPEAARTGRTQAGLDIFSGTLTEAAFPPESFDYVRLNHCFEHVPDPNETLGEIRRVLKPSGKLMIGVPNIAGLTFRLFGPWWYYLCPPVHLFHYTPRTLTRMLEKNGFLAERVRANSNYHGWLDGLQILLNRGTSRTADQGWAVQSRALRILAHRWARLLDLLGAGDCMEAVASKACPGQAGKNLGDRVS